MGKNRKLYYSRKNTERLKCVPRDSVGRKHYIPKKRKQGKKIMSLFMGKSG